MNLKTLNTDGITIQSGVGIPEHNAGYGTLYYDITTKYCYEYTIGWNLKSQIQSVVEIDMKSSLNTSYTILPQTFKSLFIPTSLVLVVTDLVGTPTTGMLTFSQSGGSGWDFIFSLNNQNALKETTYLFDESYNGRSAIDLQNLDWTVMVTEQSNASRHKITLITNGTIIPVGENIEVLFESGIVENTFIEDLTLTQNANILSNCVYYDGTSSSVFTFSEMEAITGLVINYSFDGNTWLVYNLGDTLVPNLYQVVDKDFILGDGFIGYISKVTITILTLYDEYQVIFLNSSGDELQEVPIVE